MKNFEQKVVKSLNRFLGVDGLSYRFPQIKFRKQNADIVVDSQKYGHWVIECKTKKIKKGDKKLYFTRDFTIDSNDKHQLEVIADFMAGTGRSGYLICNWWEDGKEEEDVYAIEMTDILWMFYRWKNQVGEYENGISYDYMKNNGIKINYSKGKIEIPKELFPLNENRRHIWVLKTKK